MSAETYSICMTNRNTAPVLAETLRTVLEQMPEGTEVIVVDGGSTDGSLEIFKSFSPRIKVIEGGQLTRGAGRDMAWREARGDVVLQLDSDRPLRPGAMAELLVDIARIRSHHGDVAVVSEDLAVYPRRLLEKVGGYRSDLNYGEDREIYDRMMRLDSMVFIEKYYTTMNWSLEHRRQPIRAKVRRAYEMARDINRVGMGFWTFMRRVRATRGLALAVAILPISFLGHLAGTLRGRISDCISPRARTVRP